MRILIALGLFAGLFYAGGFQMRVMPTGTSAASVRTGSGGTAHVMDGQNYPPKP